MVVKCFKLVSGEELLSELVTEDTDVVTLANPHAMLITPEGQLAMAVWLPLSDDKEVVLQKRDILVTYNPTTALANAYKQKTGGIVAASASVLGSAPNWGGVEENPNFSKRY